MSQFQNNDKSIINTQDFALQAQVNNSQNPLVLHEEGKEDLTAIVNMIPVILANLGQIESIPVTIHAENLSVSANGITVDKLRVGLNIIPKQ